MQCPFDPKKKEKNIDTTSYFLKIKWVFYNFELKKLTTMRFKTRSFFASFKIAGSS